MLGLDPDARGVHFDRENAPPAGPTVEHHARGPIVKLEQRADEIDVGHQYPAGHAVDAGHLAAAHPAQGVDRVHAVVQHVVAGVGERLDQVLVEFAHRVHDRPALQALLAQVDDHGAGAPLKADLGDAALGLRQVGQRFGLVEREAHRLFDIDVQALLQAPHPDVVHRVRLPDDIDRVGGHLLDHPAIVDVPPLDAVFVGRRT